MNMLMIGDWLVGALATIFLSIFDGIAYWLLSVSYNIFYAVAQLDIFGGSDAGATLYESITQRVYMILSIVMVFIFAYQLIMLIVDPEGKSKEAASHIVRDTLISIVLVIVLPLVYRYMAIFQYHVLENNTIPAIIMGTNASSGVGTPGKNIAMMVMISFYHPEGTTYNTFFDENGKIASDAVDACKNESESDDGSSMCEEFVGELQEWENATKGNGLKSLVWNWSLRKKIGEGMDYIWILSTIAALCATWLFFSYALDIGVRAVKLGILQLISPIPVILRIFPQTKKSFDKWFFQMKKTYLELFARIAVIFFALEIIKLVPNFIEIIFDSNNNIDSGAFTKCVATVILILGILRFCQDAPKLFKEIFDTGGGLFSDINFKPGVRSRLEENKALMAGINRTVPMLSSGVGQFLKAYDDNKAAIGDEYSNNPMKAAAHAIPSALRGMVTGFNNKSDITKLSFDSIKNASADSAKHTEEVMGSNERIKKLRDARSQYLKDSNNNADPAAQDAAFKNYIKGIVNTHKDEAKTWWAVKKENGQDYVDALKGVGANISIDADSLSKMSDTIKDVFDGAGISSINEKISKYNDELKNIAKKNADGSDNQEYITRKKNIDDLKAERNAKFKNNLNNEQGKAMAQKFAAQFEEELKKNNSLTSADKAIYLDMVNKLKSGNFDEATLQAMLDNKKSIDSLSKVLKTSQKFDAAQAEARKKSQAAKTPPTNNNSGGSK